MFRLQIGGRGRLAVLTLALTTLGSDVVCGQAPETLEMRLYLAGTLRDGARGGFAVEEVPARAGGTDAATLFARATDDFAVAAGTGLPPEWLARFTHEWSITMKRLPGKAGSATVDVEWHRRALSGDAAEAGDHRTVTLKEGERHVLDFIPIPAGRTANVVLELEASHVSEPQFESSELAYDLWLVHEGPGGARVMRQVSMSARHGEVGNYRFQPLEFSMAAGGQGDAVIQVVVDGMVRGRLREDGNLELTLQTRRALVGGTRGQLRHLGGADVGEKTFTAKPGETVGMVLPAPGGSFSFKANFSPPATPAPGVTITNGVVIVERGRFFEGTTTVMVTVRKM